MMTQVILMLGLFFIGTSYAALGFLDKIPGKAVLSGFTEAAMGTVNKYLLDKVDGKGVSDRYNAVFKEIKEDFSYWSCVAGLYADVIGTAKSLTLNRGNITELENLSMMTEILREDDNYVTVSVKFTLPSLSLKYDFHYTSWRIIPIKKDGSVILKQNGLTLEFTVEMPKTHTRIDALIGKKKCVAKVKDFKTDVDSKLLTCDEVIYESYANSVGLGVTGGSVRDIVNALIRYIQKNIVDAFTLLTEPTFRGFPFNCQNAEYNFPTGAAAQKAIDCNHVVLVKKLKL